MLRGILLLFLLGFVLSGLSVADTFQYAYDNQNRLISVENPGKYRIEYSYDLAGNLTAKTVELSETSYDSDHDGDIDGKDLYAFMVSWNGTTDNLADFAMMFGTNWNYHVTYTIHW